MASPLRSAAGNADVGVFGIPVNGFHPQLTAVSNPVRPNDVPPPSWPSYVPPPPSRRGGERRNRRRGAPASSSAPLSSPPRDTSTAPITSDIDARMTIVVRRLQDDAKESDRSRSQMLRKRVRREERSERRHLKKRLRRQGRRTSETTETSFSSTTSSLTTSTGTGTDTSSSSITTASYAGSSDASACCSGSLAAHSGAASSSSTVQSTCPPVAATTAAESRDHAKIATSTSGYAQPITMHAEAAAAPSIDEETHFSELYSEIFMASNKPQFLSTLGGRVVSWNEEFLAATGLAKAQLSGCLTVHNLVDSKYHAVLNDLFELALRGDTDLTKSHFASHGGSVADNKAIQTAATASAAVVVASGETTAMSSDDARERQIAAAMAPPSSICLDRSMSPRSDLSDEKDELLPCTSTSQEDSSSAQYTSLMLPCALFPRRGLAHRQVTIVLMNDVDPSRRCFYCVISPMESNLLSSTRDAGGIFPPLLVDQPKGMTTFGDGGNGSPLEQPLLPASQNALGMVRKIGDSELANLL